MTITTRLDPQALWNLAVDVLREQGEYFRTHPPSPLTRTEQLAYGFLVASVGIEEAEMWMREMGL